MDQITLVFASRSLDDSRTLSDYNLSKESTVYFIPRIITPLPETALIPCEEEGPLDATADDDDEDA